MSVKKSQYQLRNLFPPFALITIFVIALVIRLWFLSNNNVVFVFDQARDATIAQEIIHGDIKIFGPTASGTNDTFFHGVLYYYILAFFHAFSESPQFVNNMLALLGSIAIFPIFLVTHLFTKKIWTSLFASLLVAFSAEHVLSSSWLSNPALVSVFFPTFLFFLTRYFLQKRPFDLFGAFFLLGLIVQSVIFGIFWMTPLIVVFAVEIHRCESTQKILNKITMWFFAFLGFVLATATMFFSEIIMIRRGILTFDSLRSFSTGTLKDPYIHMVSVFDLVTSKIGFSLFPQYAAFSFLLVILTVYLIRSKVRPKLFHLLVLLTMTPVLFLFLYYRQSYHVFIGFEIIVFLWMVLLFDHYVKHVKPIVGWTIVSVFLFTFSFSNIRYLKSLRQQNDSPYTLQKGFMLREQLQLIDKTYELADGEQFSIATLTNPYAVNVTWGYLFDSYGRNKYGYEPYFYGPDQTGWPGSELLRQTSVPEKYHFSIIEPDTGIPTRIYSDFIIEQWLNAGTPSAKLEFGSLRLDVHPIE